MRKDLIKLLRLFSIYAVGDSLNSAIGFLLIPLYTAFLKPDEYGILALADAVSGIATVVFSMGLIASVLKFYYDLESNERERLYGSLWIFLISVSGAILAAIELSRGKPFNLLLNQVSYSPYIRLALWGSYLNVAFTMIPAQLFRASEKAFGYTSLKVGTFLLTTALCILLVAVVKWGVIGVLWARLVATVTVAVICVFILLKKTQITFDSFLTKRALSYGMPLVPHFLSRWALHISDRIILERYVSLSEIGVYSIGYRFGSVLNILSTAANNALFPMFGRFDIQSPAEDRQQLSRVITYYVLSMTLIAVGIALFSGEAIRLLTPSSYHPAIDVVPWIALGYFFMMLYFPSMDIVSLIMGDTKKISLCTTIAALVNIGLNFWLIPLLGIIGAALTTAIAYFILALGLFLYANRAQIITYEYRRILAIIAAGISTFLIGWNLAPDNISMGLLVKVISLFAFPIVLIIFRFFDVRERKLICSMWTNTRRKLSQPPRPQGGAS